MDIEAKSGVFVATLITDQTHLWRNIEQKVGSLMRNMNSWVIKYEHFNRCYGGANLTT